MFIQLLYSFHALIYDIVHYSISTSFRIEFLIKTFEFRILDMGHFVPYMKVLLFQAHDEKIHNVPTLLFFTLFFFALVLRLADDCDRFNMETVIIIVLKETQIYIFPNKITMFIKTFSPFQDLNF